MEHALIVPAPAVLSLVEQVRQLSPPVEEPAETPEEETRILPDGYRRLSPVQPYTIPPSGRRRRLKRILLVMAILAGIIALFAGLVIYMSIRYLIAAMPKFF